MRRVWQGLLGLGVAMMGMAAVGCTKLPPPTPLEDLNAQQMHGHAVFQARCGVCHYDRQNGPLHGPSLMGMFKQEYLPSGAPANDDRVMATIVLGRGMMPAMGRTMDAQEREDLLAYLHTL
jgi:mono/diheme cytochrome c family protein